MTKIELPSDWGLSAPYAVVVPAYDEHIDTLTRLIASCQEEALVILVVNRSQTSPWGAAGANGAAISQLRQLYGNTEDKDGLILCSNRKLPKLLIVDRSSDGRTIEGGVGQARKIGCDIVFDLQSTGKIKSPWIHNTDADSVLPHDFFSAAEKVYRNDEKRRSALCLRGVKGFTSEPDLELATDLDQFSVSFVAASLARTRAPWPITVSGCGLSISHWAYYAVGGILDNNAREDGLLINAAGKLGLIHRIYGQRVLTEARAVSRPPVGYANTIACIRDNLQEHGLQLRSLSNPMAYAYTDAVYRTIEGCLVDRTTLQAACRKACSEASERWGGKEIDQAEVLDTILHLVGPVDAMVRNVDARQAYLQIHKMLDLRGTLRVCFGFGRRLWPQVSWSEALELSPWLAASRETKDLGKALWLVMRDEDETCEGDWGPYAGAEKLFGVESETAPIVQPIHAN